MNLDVMKRWIRVGESRGTPVNYWTGVRMGMDDLGG